MSFISFFNTYCQDRGFNIDPYHTELIENLDQWQDSPQGWYIWGDVGRGKSTIAKAFYEYYPCSKKQWVHFTDWISTVQKQLSLNSVSKIYQEKFLNSLFFQRSPMDHWVKNYVKNYKILFLDELTLHHIADGIIIQKVFNLLLKKKLKIIITSNTPPESLYAQGINRERLLPLFLLLKEQLKVVNLQGNEDFRYKKRTKNFHYFLDKQKMEEFMQKIFPIEKCTIFSITQGQRLFNFNKVYQDIAFCSFDELCTQNRSLQDYQVLFSYAKSLFLYDIPEFNQEKINSIRRFIILIDFIYEYKINLSMHGLIPFTDITGSLSDTLPLKRTFSRLIEMLSK